MEPQKTKTGALDFFLHLGVVVVLYITVGFLLNLLFTVINTAYPLVDSYYYTPSISFPVAALIVLFPIFVLLSWLTYRSYDADSNKKQLGVRKWLTYLTLFVTGAIIAGDLITVIYYFLDGRDFSTSFVLKAFSILLVAIMVFGYYLNDLRDKITSSQRKIWVIVAGILVLGTIVAGFSVIGSPKTQRLIRYDQKKLSDLQNIQSQIIQYWQTKGALPINLDAMKDSLSYFTIPTDPQTKTPYTFNVSSATSFELCATFNLDSGNNQAKAGLNRAYYAGDPNNENWAYKSGQSCFERTIDQQKYPIAPKPIY